VIPWEPARRAPYPLSIVVDERALAERLISYDTSRPEELAAAAAFVRGWLEAREIEVREHAHNGLPVLIADVGGEGDGCPNGSHKVGIEPGRLAMAARSNQRLLL